MSKLTKKNIALVDYVGIFFTFFPNTFDTEMTVVQKLQ